MKGKIGLEEHFAIPETLNDSERYFEKNVWKEFSYRITDFMDFRLREMDKYGMDLMILSLNSPAIQCIPERKRAIEVAKKANDTMAEAISRRPDRFRGFAALPMQDVDAAIDEMYRAVKQLGCVGVLVNGFSQIDTPDHYLYLDDPIYRPFWAELEKLDVPFYMHPREPMPCNLGQMQGHPWRLMCSGLFDEFPKLKYILGHLGEPLPFCIWRTQNRINKTSRGIPAKRSLVEYMQENMYFTTSGQFRTPALMNVLAEFGSDRVLFATDFPFEEISDACEWFDHCPIGEEDRYKIGRSNSEKLFKLEL